MPKSLPQWPALAWHAALPSQRPRALAQAPAADSHSSRHPAAAANAPQADSSEGEVTRGGRRRPASLTLRHGELKNLRHATHDHGVPRGRTPAHARAALRPGDKVRFRAEQVKGAYYATRIEKAQ